MKCLVYVTGACIFLVVCNWIWRNLWSQVFVTFFIFIHLLVLYLARICVSICVSFLIIYSWILDLTRESVKRFRNWSWKVDCSRIIFSAIPKWLLTDLSVVKYFANRSILTNLSFSSILILFFIIFEWAVIINQINYMKRFNKNSIYIIL